MSQKSHKPEEIVAKLRQVDVLVSQGRSVSEAVRAISVTAFTYYRWRKEFGGLKGEQVKRLKDLEKENERLRKAVSDLTPEKLILKQAASDDHADTAASADTDISAFASSETDPPTEREPRAFWTLSQAVAWLATGDPNSRQRWPAVSDNASPDQITAAAAAHYVEEAMFRCAAERLRLMVPQLRMKGLELPLGAYPQGPDLAKPMGPIPQAVRDEKCVLPFEWLGRTNEGNAIGFEVTQFGGPAAPEPVVQFYTNVKVSERDIRRLAPKSAEAQLARFLEETMLASPNRPVKKAVILPRMEKLNLRTSKDNFERLWKASAEKVGALAWIKGGRRKAPKA